MDGLQARFEKSWICFKHLIIVEVRKGKVASEVKVGRKRVGVKKGKNEGIESTTHTLKDAILSGLHKHTMYVRNPNPQMPKALSHVTPHSPSLFILTL